MGVEHRRSPSLVGESPIIVTNSSLLVVNMSRLSFAFFALSSSILLVNGQLELRNFLGNCVNSGTNLDSCLLQLADKLKPYMKTGIPSLNIPKTDPMDVVNGKLRIVQDPDVTINVEGLNVQMENPFGGEADGLAKVVLRFVNKESDKFIKDFQPEIVKQVSQLIKTFFNSALDNIPVSTFE